MDKCLVSSLRKILELVDTFVKNKAGRFLKFRFLMFFIYQFHFHRLWVSRRCWVFVCLHTHTCIHPYYIHVHKDVVHTILKSAKFPDSRDASRGWRFRANGLLILTSVDWDFHSSRNVGKKSMTSIQTPSCRNIFLSSSQYGQPFDFCQHLKSFFKFTFWFEIQIR